MIQLTEVVKRVKTTFGDEAGIQITDEKIYMWVTDAVREAALQDSNLLQWVDTQSVGVGINSIEIPADAMEIHALHIDYKKIPYATIQELDQRGVRWYVADDTKGTPLVWTRYANTIRIYPPPDEQLVCNIFYSKRPTAVAGPDDAVDLPEYYFNYLVDFCLMRAYEMDEDWEAVAAKAGIVQATLDANAMRNNYYGKDFYPSITEVD